MKASNFAAGEVVELTVSGSRLVHDPADGTVYVVGIGNATETGVISASERAEFIALLNALPVSL